MKKVAKMLRISIILIFTFPLLVKPLFGQRVDAGRKYDTEVKTFIKFIVGFIRKDILNKEDTLIVRNYLCNKKMFGKGYFIEAQRPENNTILTKDELKYISQQSQSDTSEYSLKGTLFSKIKLVHNKVKYSWKMSKPIFLREYNVCVFSFSSEIIENERTVICKRINNEWSVVADWVTSAEF